MDDETPGVGPATTETPAPGTGETVTPGTDPAETSATGTGATGTGADGTGEGIVPPRRSFLQDYGFLILIGVFFYFLMLRPERARKRQRQEMLSALKKNDRIVTSSGILGVVTEVQKDEVALRIDDEKNVRIRITRSAVANVMTAQGENKATA